MKVAPVGSTVRVTAVGRQALPYFAEGDVGVVLENPLPGLFNEPGSIFVDFNQGGNPRVFEDGFWWLQPSVGAKYEVITN